MKGINGKTFVLIISALLLAFGLAGSGPTLAQTSSTTSITGHVKDPQGASVQGATVTLYSRARTSSLTTTTDSTGSYRFEKLAGGEYLVEGAAQGFASANAERVTVERGQVLTHDISLELSGVRSTVVVTASDPPQSVDEVSKAITIVDKQDIEDRDESAELRQIRSATELRGTEKMGPRPFTLTKP